MHNKLTKREIEVLRLIAEGKSNPEIAVDLCVSVHTVKAHVRSIAQKMSVDNRIQIAVKATKDKLL